MVCPCNCDQNSVVLAEKVGEDSYSNRNDFTYKVRATTIPDGN